MSYKYDAADNLIYSNRSDNGLTNVREFDVLNRPERFELPFGVVVEFEYGYDQYWRSEEAREYFGGASSPARSRYSVYDAADRLVSRSLFDGEVVVANVQQLWPATGNSLTIDRLHQRTLWVKQGNDWSNIGEIVYGYDAAARVRQITITGVMPPPDNPPGAPATRPIESFFYEYDSVNGRITREQRDAYVGTWSCLSSISGRWSFILWATSRDRSGPR
jgi:hypothetical protein